MLMREGRSRVSASAGNSNGLAVVLDIDLAKYNLAETVLGFMPLYLFGGRMEVSQPLQSDRNFGIHPKMPVMRAASVG